MVNNRVVIRAGFWHPTEKFADPNLYSDELGWSEQQKVESGGYIKTFDVWKHLVGISDSESVGFDLCFYYLGNDKMYYLDNIDEVIYELPLNPDWDGRYLIDKYQNPTFDKEEAKDVFVFDHPDEVWTRFRIDGKGMSYILNHSVLFLST